MRSGITCLCTNASWGSKTWKELFGQWMKWSSTRDGLNERLMPVPLLPQHLLCMLGTNPRLWRPNNPTNISHIQGTLDSILMLIQFYSYLHDFLIYFYIHTFTRTQTPLHSTLTYYLYLSTYPSVSYMYYIFIYSQHHFTCSFA